MVARSRSSFELLASTKDWYDDSSSSQKHPGLLMAALMDML